MGHDPRAHTSKDDEWNENHSRSPILPQNSPYKGTGEREISISIFIRHPLIPAQCSRAARIEIIELGT